MGVGCNRGALHHPALGSAVCRRVRERWLHFERRVGGSWRADETYVKVRGGWMFLYRAVDERGRTVESYLSQTRDVTAAKAFFRKALKHHGEPQNRQNQS